MVEPALSKKPINPSEHFLFQNTSTDWEIGCWIGGDTECGIQHSGNAHGIVNTRKYHLEQMYYAESITLSPLVNHHIHSIQMCGSRKFESKGSWENGKRQILTSWESLLPQIAACISTESSGNWYFLREHAQIVNSWDHSHGEIVKKWVDQQHSISTCDTTLIMVKEIRNCRATAGRCHHRAKEPETRDSRSHLVVTSGFRIHCE